MRIIVPKGTPRSNNNGTTNNTTNTNNNPNLNDREPEHEFPLPMPYIPPPARGGYGVRTSPPRDFTAYGYDPVEVPPPARRRKQSKKHKGVPTVTSTASYYNNADLDDGYNSSDEHGGSKPSSHRTTTTTTSTSTSCGQGLLSEIENDMLFEEELKIKKGYYVKKTKEDGNCLFRAIADQIYGDEEMHASVRKLCMDYMEKERDHFSQFLTEEFTSYVARKREDKCFGNHVEMQALSEVYGRPMEVYHGRNLSPLNIFHESYNTDYPPIRLSYHQGNHYNSIIDPNNPSVGVGLGLPAYKPGHADKMQVIEAMRLSEQDEIEKVLLESSRQSSEYHDIEREIEEAVLAASRAEYIASLLAGVQVPPSLTTTTTTTRSSPSPRSPSLPPATTATTTTTSTYAPPSPQPPSAPYSPPRT